MKHISVVVAEVMQILSEKKQIKLENEETIWPGSEQ